MLLSQHAHIHTHVDRADDFDVVGITQYTSKGHIARAALEAACFQTAAILSAMEKDSGHSLRRLAVDGGMSNSDLCMQVSKVIFPNRGHFLLLPLFRIARISNSTTSAKINDNNTIYIFRTYY
jgi:hypothetical protein